MLQALIVSLLAGLATSIGGLLAMNKRTLEREYLAISLAFAAGAMLLVSFMEILPLGVAAMRETRSGQAAQAIVGLLRRDRVRAAHRPVPAVVDEPE